MSDNYEKRVQIESNGENCKEISEELLKKKNRMAPNTMSGLNLINYYYLELWNVFNLQDDSGKCTIGLSESEIRKVNALYHMKLPREIRTIWTGRRYQLNILKILLWPYWSLNVTSCSRESILLFLKLHFVDSWSYLL